MNMSKKRIAALQEMLVRDGVDAAVYATSPAFIYLLDIPKFWIQRYGVTLGTRPESERPTLTRPETLLYVPAAGEPVVFTIPQRKKDLEELDCKVIVSHIYYFANKLSPYIHGGKVAVGLAARGEVTQMIREADACHGGTVETVYGEPYVQQLRMIKDEKEIGLMREVAHLTDYAMEEIVKILKPGITPYEVEEKIAAIGEEAGCEDLSFGGACIGVEKGYRTSYDPYIFPKDRPFRMQTGIAFDMGYVLNGYSSDYGRSFYLGEPSKEAVESYAALQAAQQYVLDHIVPGQTPVASASDLLFEGLQQFGRGYQLRNHEGDGVQGHQIGIDVHENPWLARSHKGVFLPGMVFCLEPKIFIPDEIYMRVEDMVLVTETGAEFLTVFDRNKFVL